jgi:hypothetical protein
MSQLLQFLQSGAGRVNVYQPNENRKSTRSLRRTPFSRLRKKSFFLRMQHTTVPRKEQNNAFDKEIR